MTDLRRSVLTLDDIGWANSYIEQLEARVAAADKLAKAAGELSLSKYGLKAARVRTALAAYQATKEGEYND